MNVHIQWCVTKINKLFSFKCFWSCPKKWKNLFRHVHFVHEIEFCIQIKCERVRVLVYTLKTCEIVKNKQFYCKYRFCINIFTFLFFFLGKCNKITTIVKFIYLFVYSGVYVCKLLRSDLYTYTNSECVSVVVGVIKHWHHVLTFEISFMGPLNFLNRHWSILFCLFNVNVLLGFLVLNWSKY